jgi:hypothetical protein
MNADLIPFVTKNSYLSSVCVSRPRHMYVQFLMSHVSDLLISTRSYLQQINNKEASSTPYLALALPLFPSIQRSSNTT